MNENDARNKWCPHVRFFIGDDNSIWQNRMLSNRGDLPAEPKDALCIASDCMMWIEHTSTSMATNKTTTCGGDCGFKNRS